MAACYSFPYLPAKSPAWLVSIHVAWKHSKSRCWVDYTEHQTHLSLTHLKMQLISPFWWFVQFLSDVHLNIYLFTGSDIITLKMTEYFSVTCSQNISGQNWDKCCTQKEIDTDKFVHTRFLLENAHCDIVIACHTSTWQAVSTADFPCGSLESEVRTCQQCTRSQNVWQQLFRLIVIPLFGIVPCTNCFTELD